MSLHIYVPALVQDIPQVGNGLQLGKAPIGTCSAWQVPITVIQGKWIELYRSLVTFITHFAIELNTNMTHSN